LEQWAESFSAFRSKLIFSFLKLDFMKLVILDYASGDVLILPYSDNGNDIEDNILQMIEDNVLDVNLDSIQYMVTSQPIQVF
jgi:hypothetical protein